MGPRTGLGPCIKEIESREASKTQCTRLEARSCGSAYVVYGFYHEFYASTCANEET